MSNRVATSELILSALFFLIAIFTLCIVLLTFLFDNFSGLFMWASKANSLYETFYVLFAAFGCVYLAAVLLRERSLQRMRKDFFVFCLSLLFVFALNFFWGICPYFVQNDHADSLRVFVSIESGQVMDIFCFLLFFLLPFVYYYHIDSPEKPQQFYTFPYSLVPSPNAMIVVLFGFAIQPLDKESWWEWWGVGATMIGIAMLAILVRNHRRLFGVYERFNLTLLVFAVIVFFVSHSVFEGYASQYAAKKAIYMLAISGWVLGVIERYRIEYTKTHISL